MAQSREEAEDGMARLLARAKELRAECQRLDTDILGLRVRKAKASEGLENVEVQYMSLARSLLASTERSSIAATTPQDITVLATTPTSARSGHPTPSAAAIDPEDDAASVVIVAAAERTSTDDTQPDAALQSTVTDNSIIHQNFPTVVYYDGVWKELSCGFCSTNFNLVSRHYFQGVRGLHQHYLHTHRADLNDSSLKSCIPHYRRRSVSGADVALMRAGLQPTDVSIKRQKPDGLQENSTTSGKGKGHSHDQQVAQSTQNQAPQNMNVKLERAEDDPINDGNAAALIALKLPVKQVTEYEVFQGLEAEAMAAGQSAGRKRNNKKRRMPVASYLDDAEYYDGEEMQF
ncbi:hypothetical protein BAUCODRAFT_150562 [Baudoinia panamericana UAMH 10762]|uniref:Uncharacterized protein n=1 Tax=Baudoinia panamericana (strain UAMH 10762) TaxID=717646 RepID=M2LGJ8_BAUPA|nr:uncharacterized protein BAUCODRAFT_150562 [Baudoinia panamericana UAMH 10762]EMC93202.1 hypothetical protein BAUCODRAFT_150562 [Baudoinia panamericana UAMH 10762]